MRALRALAGAGLGVCLAVALAAGAGPASTGCMTHQCDSDIVCIDSTGSMKTIGQASECTPVIAGGTPIPFYNLAVFSNTDAYGNTLLSWATSSILGPWLDFPGQRTYIINFPPGLAGHEPANFSGLESSDLDAAPDASHRNFTTASGQLLEFSNLSPTQVWAQNATCAEYGLRLFFEATVTPSDAGTTPPPDALPLAEPGDGAAMSDAEATE